MFNGLLRYCPQPINRFPTVDYLHSSRPDTLLALVKGYENKDVANNCGTILRESFKHQALAHVVLYDERFWRFFDYVQGGSFDIASDAFGTFRVRANSCLVENRPILTRLIGALDQTQTAGSAIPQSKLYSSSWIITLTSPNFFRIFLTIIVVLLEV